MCELFRTDNLVAWLKTQPADLEYQWENWQHCLMGRYLGEHGYDHRSRPYTDMPGYPEFAEAKPHTFGAALKRLENA